MDTCQYAKDCNHLPYTGGSMIFDVVLVVGLAVVLIGGVLLLVDGLRGRGAR
jgi:hypothetical protein